MVCGLDSIVARRWINGMLLSMLDYDEDGQMDRTTLIPLIDGGTEGFKGGFIYEFIGLLLLKSLIINYSGWGGGLYGTDH